MSATQYQLVLQFRGDSMPEIDALVELEDQVVEVLGDAADVDGHDIGRDEANIFVMTRDPEAAFRKALPVLRSQSSFSGLIAAFRTIDGEAYSVVWPSSFKGAFSVQ